jgi:hypothetical protein
MKIIVDLTSHIKERQQCQFKLLKIIWPGEKAYRI